MRLICPNCDAQYEVPADVVPQDGRDVQCSNCGQTWFQYHPDHLPANPEDTTDTASDSSDEPDADEEYVEIAEPPRKELDPQVSDILREEAEFETAARAHDAGSLETQPELGLEDTEDESGKRAREARDRMARMRGEEPKADVIAAAIGSRRDLLPDIEEINSTLRSTGDRQISGEAAAAASSEPRRPKRNGFRQGFFSVVIIAIVLAIIYLMAPAIAESIPELEPVMSGYVAAIDQARVWLDVKVQGMQQWLDATAASQTGG